MKTEQKRALIGKLLAQLDEFDRRYSIAEECIGKRVGLKQMSDEELDKMLYWCIAQGAVLDARDSQGAADKMRKKIISLFRSQGFNTYKNGDTVADMARIKAYILEVGYLKKELDAYTPKELVKLVSQMEKIYDKEVKNFKRK